VPRRLALIVVGLVAALLLGEGLLRLIDAVPEVANPLYSFHVGDAVLGWRGKPGITRRFRRPQFDARIVHDAAGWRAPLPLAPPAAPRRVLVLGDSFTWGWGVAQGEVYTDHLQRARPDAAIANRGVNGFGTAQEYLLLRQELAAGRVDLVLVQVFVNDLADNLDGKGGRRPLFELDGDALAAPSQPLRPLQDPVRTWLKDHSRVFLLLDYTGRALGGGNAAGARLAPPRDAPPVEVRDVPGGELTARLLAAMQAAATAHGAHFAVLYAPHRLEIEGAVPPPVVRAAHALAHAVGSAPGAAWIDLTAPLAAAAAAGAPVLFAGDEHWTPAGHRVVADAILSSGVFDVAPPSP